MLYNVTLQFENKNINKKKANACLSTIQRKKRKLKQPNVYNNITFKNQKLALNMFQQLKH